MPYMLVASPNLKKKIQGVLSRHGIKHTPGPLEGYVIVYETSQKVLEDLLPGIEMIAPISEAEIEIMSQMANAPVRRIGVKDMVKVVSGKYSGFHGIVTRVDEKQVSIGINIFGKVVPVIVGMEDVEKATAPDWA